MNINASHTEKLDYARESCRPFSQRDIAKHILKLVCSGKNDISIWGDIAGDITEQNEAIDILRQILREKN